jgi:hypothetical protein
MIRLSLAGNGSFPAWWLERLPVRDFAQWCEEIAAELEFVRTESAFD